MCIPKKIWEYISLSTNTLISSRLPIVRILYGLVWRFLKIVKSDIFLP